MLAHTLENSILLIIMFLLSSTIKNSFSVVQIILCDI